MFDCDLFRLKDAACRFSCNVWNECGWKFLLRNRRENEKEGSENDDTKGLPSSTSKTSEKSLLGVRILSTKLSFALGCFFCIFLQTKPNQTKIVQLHLKHLTNLIHLFSKWLKVAVGLHHRFPTSPLFPIRFFTFISFIARESTNSVLKVVGYLDCNREK